MDFFIMKTNVVMVRKIGDLEVLQRTKDGYFDGNILLSQWNKKTKGERRRKMSEFLESPKTKEFIQTILNDPRGENDLPVNQVFISIPAKTPSTGKKIAGNTWMHPYLFIDFAMWINPGFKLAVLRFVYDELIKQRNDAGDNYVTLSRAGKKLQGYDYVKVATAMQWIVYGKQGKNLRQTATQEQLQEINDIQTKLAFAIDMNFIITYEQLLIEMRKMYNKKYQKF